MSRCRTLLFMWSFWHVLGVPIHPFLWLLCSRVLKKYLFYPHARRPKNTRLSWPHHKMSALSDEHLMSVRCCTSIHLHLQRPMVERRSVTDYEKLLSLVHKNNIRHPDLVARSTQSLEAFVQVLVPGQVLVFPVLQQKTMMTVYKMYTEEEKTNK